MRRLARSLLLLALLALAAGGACAQSASAPLTLVNERTEVRSIDFRFTDTQTFPVARLKEQIALTEQGALVGVRRTLAVLPFVAPPGVHPFLPVELARDARRLERFYRRNGFLFPEVDWLVRLDSARNTVAVLFTITEGPPLRIDTLAYEAPDGRPARTQFPPELHPAWERFKARAAVQAGQRLDEFRLLQLQEDALRWVRDRGYPFSSVAARTVVDSVASRAAVTIVLDTGPRARVGTVHIEGNERVRDRAIRRELPLRSGDLFSQRRLVDGQRQVFGLDAFQIALADVPPQEPGETVDVRIRVREAPPRQLVAQAGYLSEAGLFGQAEWVHRNFLGDARTLRATALANTGLGALAPSPDRRYRGALTLRQPYVFDRRLSATASAFADFRDDAIDRSRGFGGEVALLYERGQFRTASVAYLFEDRRVQEFRFGGGSGGDGTTSLIELFVLEAARVSTNLSRSVLVLGGTYGALDNPLDPRRGFVLRPSIQLTLPFPAAAELDYQRLSLNAAAYVPLGERLTLAGRAGVARLLPRGEAADPEDAFLGRLRLRDVTPFAGGTQDVRGWAPRYLGQKAVDVLVREVEDEDGQTRQTFSARDYFVLGGTARATASVEARLAVTDLFGAFAFLDAGRVWTPDAPLRLPRTNPLFDGSYGNVERVFFGTGAGLSLASPVGAIQVALGYKLNPSFFDVRNPDDLARAFGEVLAADPDAPLQALLDAAEATPARFWRRLRLHLSIGQTF